MLKSFPASANIPPAKQVRCWLSVLNSIFSPVVPEATPEIPEAYKGAYLRTDELPVLRKGYTASQIVLNAILGPLTGSVEVFCSNSSSNTSAAAPINLISKYKGKGKG